MHRHLSGLFLYLALFAPAILAAPDVNQDRITEARERTQTSTPTAIPVLPIDQSEIRQVKVQIQVLDKDVSILKEVTDHRLDAQDKRIGDLDIWTGQQANHMAAISNVTAFVGTLITLIAIAASFVIYFSTKDRASNEAKEAAERWFEKNNRQLHEQIEKLKSEAEQHHKQIKVITNEANELQSQVFSLQQKATEAHSEIDLLKTGVVDHAKKTHQVFDNAAQQILSQPVKDQSSQKPVDPAAADIVRQASLALESKPEKEFTSHDHFARGLNEYLAERFDSALLSFDKSLDHAKSELMSAENYAGLMFSRALVLGRLGRNEDEIAAYDEIVRRYDNNDSPALRQLIAESILNKGVRLGQIDRIEDEIAAYDEIDQRYGKDDNLALREQVAKALLNKGIVLGQLDRRDSEITIYSEIDRRYCKDESNVLRRQVAMALVNKGHRLAQDDRREEAIATFDEVDLRYGKDESTALREQVAMSLINKGISLGHIGRTEEAIARFEEVDLRFGNDESTDLRKHVAAALINKGHRLAQDDRSEEAIATFDEVDRRYGNEEGTILREQVAIALVRKSIVLEKLGGRGGDAVAVYDEIISRYSADDNDALRTKVTTALNTRAFNRILLAKENWQAETERRALLAQAIDDLDHAQNRCAEDDRPIILGNLGYALFLSEETSRAQAPTLECLRLGGEESLEGQRNDARMHRVEPLDSEYEKLLDRLWSELHPKT